MNRDANTQVSKRAFWAGRVLSGLMILFFLFDIGFAVFFALLVWGGLYLREPRLRALLPLRR